MPKEKIVARPLTDRLDLKNDRNSSEGSKIGNYHKFFIVSRLQIFSFSLCRTTRRLATSSRESYATVLYLIKFTSAYSTYPL